MAPDETIRSTFKLLDCGRIEGPAGVAGTYHPDQKRINWDMSALGVSDSLIKMVEEEASLWNSWAEDEATQKTSSGTDSDTKTKTGAGWLARYPKLRQTLETAGLPLELTGKRILDIGGSGKDMVYWLADKPARIDHVEVSPKSQSICLRKIEAANIPETPPIFFHTVPAEHLPFDDNCFDFVFSRSTLHHCVRPIVFDQVYRVLKPSGVFLCAENYRGSLLYTLMTWDRRLRQRDRGTDDPFQPSDVTYLDHQYQTSAKSFQNPSCEKSEYPQRGRHWACISVLPVERDRWHHRPAPSAKIDRPFRSQTICSSLVEHRAQHAPFDLYRDILWPTVLSQF